MLAGLVGGAGVLVGSRTIAAPTTKPRKPLVASPAQTIGPYFNDAKLNRSNLIGDATREAVANGVPLTFTLAIYHLAGEETRPMTGAQIDLWHCDAAGAYSGEDQPPLGIDTTGESWLRGYQTTGEDGCVTFETIVPGWYPGRTPHIHVLVRPPVEPGGSQTAFASQLYFEDGALDDIYADKPYRGKADTSNRRDGIFQARLDDGSPSGDQLLLELEPSEQGGFTSALPILLTGDRLQRAGQLEWTNPGGGPGGGERGGGGARR